MVLTLVSIEIAYRVKREVQIIRLTENAQQAFYTAEMGFSQVSSAMIQCQSALGLHNPTTPQAITYTDEAGATRSAGSYTLDVQDLGGDAYHVISKGEFGSGTLATTRVVKGTVTVVETVPGADGNCDYRRIEVLYDP